MKKIVLAMCFLGFATTANATCNGGTERSGFCISNIGLNWWTAAAWCQANGRTLATMYDVCPDWNGNIGGKCPVLGGNGYAWTATASGNSDAFVVHLVNAGVNVGSGRTNIGCAAICK